MSLCGAFCRNQTRPLSPGRHLVYINCPTAPMPIPPPAGLNLRWFLLMFVGAWLAISGIISFAGGWHALARKFRGGVSGSGTMFSFASMGMGRGRFPVSYRNCLFVRFDSAGLALSVFPLFRFFHPNLLIPWSAIAACKKERFWFMNCTAIYVSNPPIRMLFRGQLGAELYEFRNAPPRLGARPPVPKG
jgi:hypothetical protein